MLHFLKVVRYINENHWYYGLLLIVFGFRLFRVQETPRSAGLEMEALLHHMQNNSAAVGAATTQICDVNYDDDDDDDHDEDDEEDDNGSCTQAGAGLPPGVSAIVTGDPKLQPHLKQQQSVSMISNLATAYVATVNAVMSVSSASPACSTSSTLPERSTYTCCNTLAPLTNAT